MLLPSLALTVDDFKARGRTLRLQYLHFADLDPHIVLLGN